VPQVLRYPFRAHLLLVLALGSTPAPSRAGSADVLRWTELTRPDRNGASLVYDSRRHRHLLIGGEGVPAAHGISVISATAPTRWVPMAVTGPSPLPRFDFGAVYDSLRDRVILFGGADTHFSPHDDVWELRFSPQPEWRLLEVDGAAPSPREGSLVFLDEAHDRLVVFGGAHDQVFGGPFTDLWTLSLGDHPRWSAMPQSDPLPPSRIGAAASLLRSRHGALIFGGAHADTVAGSIVENGLADTWELDFDDTLRWTAVSTTGIDTLPDAEVSRSMVTSRVAEGLLMLPGPGRFDLRKSWDGLVWRLDEAQHKWASFRPTGERPTRYTDNVAWDPDSGRILVLPTGSTVGWSLDLAGAPSWRALSAGPGPPSYPDAVTNLVYDAAHQRVLSMFADGVWASSTVDDSGWRRLPASGAPVPIRSQEMVVGVPSRDEVLVIGGWSPRPYSEPTAGIWACLLETGAGRLVPFLADSGVGFVESTAILDARRNRLLVYAGNGQSLWALDLGDTMKWRMLSNFRFPGGIRTLPAMVIDPVRDRLLLIGGGYWDGGSGIYYNDVWETSLGDGVHWQPLQTGGVALSRRMGSTAIYDAAHDRVLLVAGFRDGLNYSDDLDPIYALDLTDSLRWRTLGWEGSEAPNLIGASVAPDLDHNRLFASQGSSLFLINWEDDVPKSIAPMTAIASAGAVSIRSGTAPGSNFAMHLERSIDAGVHWSLVAVLKPAADGSVVGSDTLPDGVSRAGYRLTAIRAGEEVVLARTWLGVGAPAALRVTGVRPNPGPGAFSIEIALPSDADVTLRLYDLAGRRAVPDWRRRLSGGDHLIASPWQGALRPGLYLLQASDGQQSSTTRVVIFR